MYRHTFVLVNGEQIVTYSDSAEIPSYKYGDVAVFSSKKGNVKYTIPVVSILCIETEEVEANPFDDTSWLENAVEQFFKNLGRDGKNGK